MMINQELAKEIMLEINGYPLWKCTNLDKRIQEGNTFTEDDLLMVILELAQAVKNLQNEVNELKGIGEDY